MKASIVALFCCVAASAWAAPKIDYQRAFNRLSFDQPVLVTHAGDGSNRLFVVEQGGQIKVFDNDGGVRSSDTFFDIRRATDNDFSSGGEEGLLGLAFDPDFANNKYFYVYYSATSPRRSVIARYQVASNNPNLADYSTEKVILEINQDYRNHNGGMIAFGPDGYLYIGMGDGGSAGDPNYRAQDGQSLLGKMLRVDRNGQAAADNPFVSDASIRDEIWAFGLRNPWRFSFDRQTGDLWAGDVGQNAWEEINVIEAGANYGWRWYEGNHEYNLDARAQGVELTGPVFEYSHSEGRSVTGGTVYRGVAFPELQGWYLFGDFVSGKMWALSTSSNDGEVLALPDFPNPAGFGEDESGELYVVSYRGQIFRIVDAEG